MAVNEEVGSKLARFLYFVGAGMITTKAINLYRDYERKAALKAIEEAKNPPAADAASVDPLNNGATKTPL